jgi:hypothetical protein
MQFSPFILLIPLKLKSKVGMNKCNWRNNKKSASAYLCPERQMGNR